MQGSGRIVGRSVNLGGEQAIVSSSFLLVKVRSLEAPMRERWTHQIS